MSNRNTTRDIPVLQPGEKIVGLAYITEEDEIVFTSQPGAVGVLLVEPQAPFSGPWAVRRRSENSRHHTVIKDPAGVVELL